MSAAGPAIRRALVPVRGARRELTRVRGWLRQADDADSWGVWWPLWPIAAVLQARRHWQARRAIGRIQELLYSVDREVEGLRRAHGLDLPTVVVGRQRPGQRRVAGAGRQYEAPLRTVETALARVRRLHRQLVRALRE